MPCHSDVCALSGASVEARVLVHDAVEYGRDVRSAYVEVRDEARDALAVCRRLGCRAHYRLYELERQLDQRLCLACKCWVGSDVADESDGPIKGHVCHDCLAAEEESGRPHCAGGCETCLGLTSPTGAM